MNFRFGNLEVFKIRIFLRNIISKRFYRLEIFVVQDEHNYDLSHFMKEKLKFNVNSSDEGFVIERGKILSLDM